MVSSLVYITLTVQIVSICGGNGSAYDLLSRRTIGYLGGGAYGYFLSVLFLHFYVKFLHHSADGVEKRLFSQPLLKICPQGGKSCLVLEMIKKLPRKKSIAASPVYQPPPPLPEGTLIGSEGRHAAV